MSLLLKHKRHSVQWTNERVIEFFFFLTADLSSLVSESQTWPSVLSPFRHFSLVARFTCSLLRLTDPAWQSSLCLCLQTSCCNKPHIIAQNGSADNQHWYATMFQENQTQMEFVRYVDVQLRLQHFSWRHIGAVCSPLSNPSRCSDPVAPPNYSSPCHVSPPVSFTADLFHWAYFHEHKLLNNAMRTSVSNLVCQHVTPQIITLIFKRGKCFMIMHKCNMFNFYFGVISFPKD